jgi:futalosine hydrolase
MKILVVAATKEEIADFTSNNKKTDVLITGVGSPACMYGLTKKLQNNKYDYIIQAGIAGGSEKHVSLCETVIVKNDVFADLGIYESDSFYSLFEKSFAHENKMPFTNGFLMNETAQTFSLKIADAITVNTVTQNKAVNDLFLKKYNASIETMEGAAFHFVCLMEKVPFLQLRTVSNFIGERDKTNWKLKEAVEQLNLELTKIIEKKNNKRE